MLFSIFAAALVCQSPKTDAPKTQPKTEVKAQSKSDEAYQAYKVGIKGKTSVKEVTAVRLEVAKKYGLTSDQLAAVIKVEENKATLAQRKAEAERKAKAKANQAEAERQAAVQAAMQAERNRQTLLDELNRQVNSRINRTGKP